MRADEFESDSIYQSGARYSEQDLLNLLGRPAQQPAAGEPFGGPPARSVEALATPETGRLVDTARRLLGRVLRRMHVAVT